MSARMPQPGLLALGTTSHAYLEFDLVDGAAPAALVKAVTDLCRDEAIGQGVNVVFGFRPELWRDVAPDGCPAEVTGFTEPVVGDDGFTMPATQHDFFVWVSGGGHDLVFDEAVLLSRSLAGTARLVDETVGWVYHHDRDLTGFVDGSENPAVSEIPEVVVVADGEPGAGASILLIQRWPHNADAWDALSVKEQEAAMGRTKADSIELENKPATSHVARTDQDVVGKIVRRNTAYGTALVHGTMFVGFCHEQSILHTMLERMAGAKGEPRDELTRFATPTTGAYYVIPALNDLEPAGA